MIGTTLAHFRITAKLGEGGMGEVYRAEDTHLGREVAIKLLPEAVASDPKRLARFEREARLLASLNHPNIAGIHQVEQVDGTHFLVMELAEGETLAERLAGGPIPVDEALPIALQIAEALEAAHEKGIIHRDLKPANVKVTQDGQVKVLDFGLAKALEPEPASGSEALLTQSPTLTAQMTGAGVILGTAAYMSPEQAKGKRVDRRADIWAFGVILWEMLTGQRLFTGESSSEILAAVLMSEPDLSALPSETPPRVRRLVERCLRRDPNSRLRDIGDARITIEESLAGHEPTDTDRGPEAPPQRPRLTRATLLVGLGFVLGAGAAWLGLGRQTPPTAAISNLAIPMPSSLRVAGNPLLSPDGRIVAFRAVDISPEAGDHRPRLFLRQLPGDELVEVERSKGATFQTMSPDGRWLAFTAPASELSSRYELLKVPVDGSTPPVKIADFPSADYRHLSWTRADRIFSVGITGDSLMSWPASGGQPGTLLPIQSERPVYSMRLSTAVPDGRHLFVYIASFVSGAYRQDVGVLDTETGNLRIVVDDASWAVSLPSGNLLYSRRDTLMAAPFDMERLRLTAGPISIMDGLWATGPWTGGTFNLSANGDLLYPAGEVQGVSNQLAVLTREGTVIPWSEVRLAFNSVWISPDGRRLATQVDNIAEGDALLQIRVSDIDRPRLVTVGSEPGRDCDRAAWSPDSLRLAYTCVGQEATALFVRNMDEAGPADTVFEVSDPTHFELIGFSSDGARILLQHWAGEGDRELVSVPARADEKAAEARVIPMEETEWTEQLLSPDGRWLAYISRQTGRRELYIREVIQGTAVGPRALVASGIDSVMTWSKGQPDGRYELLASRSEKLVSIETQTQPNLRIGQPVDTGLDPFALGILSASGLSDGRLMIVRAPDTQIGAAELRLVLNWAEGLRRHLTASSNQ